METKDLLVRAALRLFRTKPYNDVSLTQIVSAVGVTKGSFFHHFSNKDDIFREAVKLYYSDGLSEGYNDFPTDSLWSFCETYIDRFWDE